MRDIDLSALILALLLSSINILIGLIVYFRNTRATINRIFLAFTIFLSLWASSSVISDGTSSYDISKIMAQLAYAFSVVGASLIWLFSVKLAGKKWHKRQYLMFIAFVAALSILFGTEHVYYLKSLEDYETGFLYIPYLLTMFGFVALTALNFIHIIRRGSKTEKSQAKIILYGLETLVVCALITNAILPIITDINPDMLTKIGPLFTVIFVGSAGLAITKHKLFDVRAVVARSFGYVSSLIAIGVLAFIAITSLTTVLDRARVSEDTQRAVYVATALALAVLYQPFKKQFDSLTRKFFYRDAYDTQDLLNDFNQVIVSTLDLEKLLFGASLTIEKYLKPQFCNFAIREPESGNLRLINIDFKDYDKSKFEKTIKALDKTHASVLITDTLEDSEIHIKQELQNSDIALTARISGNNTSGETLGYVVLGFKKSGNLYNLQDTGAIQIIANELSIAISNALQFEEIQKFNITLQEKIDSATKQLRSTNNKLKQLDETKDEFISMASHQLRTPLTSVKGYISMVMEGDAGKLNKNQTKLLNQAFISSQRMVYLIADLLNVSRLRTGKFVIENVMCDLSEVVKSEVEQLQETAESRGLELVHDVPKEMPEYPIDETKIRQVIMNFIDNAIYYSRPGGKIKVILQNNESHIKFMVEDNGIGVPKSEQPHLFGKFYRAGNAQKARPDGTGLGLFMAKKVIIAQGGSIIFKSREGQGSTFGFTVDKKNLIANKPQN